MLKKILFIFFALCTISCAPRGESGTVEEVFQTQRDKYNGMVNSAQLKNEVAASLKEVSQKLEELVASDDKALAAAAESLSKNLVTLTSSAGYTSRPSLTELVNQYRNLMKEPSAKPAALKLLAARTYSALASELETTKFAL